MLHELLLALVGCTGDVFIDSQERQKALGLPPFPELSLLAAQNSDSGDCLDRHHDHGDGYGDGEEKEKAFDGRSGNNEEEEEEEEEMIVPECTFCLAPDLSFLQHSEREILERLLHLGFYYRELEKISLRYRNLSWIASPYSSRKKKSSIYCRALANGIAEILAVYRSAVLKVEQSFLSDSIPVLASVTQGLNQFEFLLPPLHILIQEVQRDDLCGGCLLNLLHKKSHCGVPQLQMCMKRLLWHGHQVMYRQIAAWMVYGLLHDPHEEFFICRQALGDNQLDSTEFEVTSKGHGLGYVDANLENWHTEFIVNSEMLPEYIPIQVAESILFVGKAVRILRNPSKGFKSQMNTSYQQEGRNMNRSPGVLLSPSFGKESIVSVGGYAGPELLPQSDADKIAALIQDLKEKPEFHKRSFECAVGSIRAIAANHLWQLVVIDADLMGHLRALKDYFLLAKGDFFQCFLEESSSLMRLPPRPSTAEADLKVPFQQAAVKTISDDDKYFSRVSLKMPSLGGPISRGDKSIFSTESIAGPSYDGWDGIALEYSVDWPLQLLFTREVLSKYCKVFQYLLRLKRIQLDLEKSWAIGMQQDRADSTKQRKDPINAAISKQRQIQRMPMWRVRQHMTYLITNLQFYIQVDVIESQWNLLQERVEASKDFTELVRFHQEYLSALISQSFLDIGSVSRILDSIIKLCSQLCCLIEQQDGTPNATELEQITHEFNKKSNSLYTILRSSKLAGSQRAPFLRQFLLRLNYNSFFEATARGALNVVRSRPLMT